MDKLIGLFTRIFLGREFAILLKLLILVPKLVDSIEPKRDMSGKYVKPLPEPNIGEFAGEIYKLVPDSQKEHHGGTASPQESKDCAYHLAKSYQYIKSLFN